MARSLMYLISVMSAVILAKELTYYADVEHPNITYWNPKYCEYVRVTAQRYSRSDPIHYISMHGKSLIDIGNNALVECFLYQFLSNEYRRSFVEIRFRLCDIFTDKKYDVFKPIYIKFGNTSLCPFPKGEYHFTNISIPNMPLLATFPFHKGRAFFNWSLERSGEPLLAGYIDWVIKQRFL